MKRPPVLLAIVLSLICGGALGYWVRPNAEPSRTSTTNVETPEDKTPGKCVRTDNPVKEPSETSAPKKEEQKNPAVLADILNAIILDLPAKGAGRITGVVKTPDGQPVKDVKISAKGIGDYNATKPDGTDPTLEEEVLALVRKRRYADLTRVDAVTDADGKYSLDGLANIAYRVKPQLDGYQISEPNEAYRAKPGITLNFTARAVIRVPFEILAPDGTAAAHARLSYRTERNGSSMQGGGPRDAGFMYLDLESGTYKVFATDMDDATIRSEEASVEVELGQVAAKITLRLIEKPCIKGNVTFEEPESSTRATVVCVPYTGTPPDPEKISGSRMPREGKGDKVKSCDLWGSQTSYSFQDLPAGNYLVFVRVDNKVVAQATVSLGAARITQDFTVAAPDPNDFVILWVYGPDGKPVAEVNLDLGYEEGGGSWGSGAQSKRRADGSYRFKKQGVPPESSGKGTFYVAVTSPKYGTMRVEYPAVGKAELTVRFEEPGILTVTLNVNIDAPELDSFVVSISSEAKDRRGSQGQCDAKDPRVYTFNGLVPGEYTLHLALKENRARRQYGTQELASQKVKIVSGAVNLILEVPKLCTLRVHFADCPAGKDVYLQRDGGGYFGINTKTDENGMVMFENLTEGQYRINRQDTREKMIVSVPASKDVEFAAQVFNAMRVTITNDKGYAATAGLQTGDLITGANGADFKNESQMQGLMQTLLEEKSVKLTVQRGSSTFEVEVELAKLFKDENTRFLPVPR